MANCITRLVRGVARALVKRPRRTVLTFSLINIALGLLILTVPVAAQGEAAAAGAGLKFIGAGIAVAGSTVGAGIGLLGATSAGLAALVERPELTVWVLILAGLAEGVAIYGLIIAILILGA
ncbi:ATPase [Candidatus Geothermarchaeota archaeon ex4572_27]|nr:MAG: ATPase [Candidatus Geothermarchaeota archaeon ex4572_27]